MKASSYETAPDTYKDLVDSLVVEQEDDEATETDSFIGFVLNDIQDAFDENSTEDTFEEYPKYQTEDVNSSREIVRERPVLKGERAMKMADELLVNRSQELSDSLLYDEIYSTNWTRSSVNYVITYLDEDVISVVFQDYMFIGSILGEDISMRTYIADINTGIRYQNEDLLKNMEDLQVANLIYEDMLLQHADSEFDTRIFGEVLTPQLMSEALQTNGTIDGRHFMNTFLTKDGVGFAFSYRVGQEIDGSYSIMRGWTKTILTKEQVAAHMTDVPVWGE